MFNKLDREKSGFNVSIATGLAMETVFNPTEKVYDDKRKVDKKDISVYKIHYFNMYTLIRNIVSSIPTMSKPLLLKDFNRSKIVYDILIEELSVMKLLYDDNTKVKPILFMPDYTKVLKNVIVRPISNPPTFKDELDILNLEIGRLFKEKDIPIDVIKGTHRLPPSRENTLITSHIPFDLLNVFKIPNLHLLESTTGVIKKPSEFNTKYPKLGKLDRTILPFTESIIYILGDGHYAKSVPFVVKKTMYDKAIEMKWSPLSNRGIVDSNMTVMLKVLTKIYPSKDKYVDKYTFVY